MKTSELLARAKRYMPHTRESGICWALSLTYADGDDIERIKDIISDRIAPFTYAPDWLAWHMAISKKPPTDKIIGEQWMMMDDWLSHQSTRKIQAWRHAWLDRLIKEFKRKGD